MLLQAVTPFLYITSSVSNGTTREIRMSQTVVGDGETAVDIKYFIPAKSRNRLALVFVPGFNSTFGMKPGIEVECCLGSITPQDFNQPNIRRHTVIPALHDNHLSAPAFARR
jgi:hypothetical protein